MKKALIVTTVSGFVPQFEMQNVHILQDMGFEVHYAANYEIPSYGDDNSRLNGTGIVRHQVDFARSPYSWQNVRAYNQLVRLMKKERFDLVHCHTPMGGVLARLAAHKTRTKPVVYTVHGFHFYKGAPLINWLLYYPVERWLAKYTDMLITINEEDYNRAKSFRKVIVRRIHGIGIKTTNVELMDEKQREKLKKKLAIPPLAVVLISVGELNENKNHKFVLKALREIKEDNIVYLICGKGNMKRKLEKLCKKYGLDNKVRLLGYRKDLSEILQISDVLVMPSKREGLPTAVMEAMVGRVAVIGSSIRGNNELIEDKVSGYLVPQGNIECMKERILQLANNEFLRKRMVEEGAMKIRKYSAEVVRKEMYKNYNDIVKVTE